MAMWKRGRAVECTGLENRQGRESFVSSNLTASATILNNIVLVESLPLIEAYREAYRIENLRHGTNRHSISPRSYSQVKRS